MERAARDAAASGNRVADRGRPRMDVDHRGALVTAPFDLRRRIVQRAFGAVRFLTRVQAAFEDVEGAIARRQFDVAAFQARYVALVCLSIRGLGISGEPEFDDELSVTFDFFAGASGADVIEAMALANEAADLDADRAPAWLERLRIYVADTERILGY